MQGNHSQFEKTKQQQQNKQNNNDEIINLSYQYLSMQKAVNTSDCWMLQCFSYKTLSQLPTNIIIIHVLCKFILDIHYLLKDLLGVVWELTFIRKK